MTFDELIDWVEAAMARLPRNRGARDRVKHLRKIYRLLAQDGWHWDYRNAWHQLATKIAKLLKEPAPGKPSRSPGRRARVAERDRDDSRRKSPWPSGVPDSPRRLAKKRAPEPIEINAELQAAFDAVTRGKQIVFVTGGAGTNGRTSVTASTRRRTSSRRWRAFSASFAGQVSVEK